MSTDYDFTDAEQAVIEKAAADHLEFNFAPSDARDMAYDIANDIREAIAAEAVAQLGRDLMEEGIEHALFHLIGEKHAVFVLNMVRAEGVENAAREVFGTTLTAHGAIRQDLYDYAKKVRATPLPGSPLAVAAEEASR